MEDRDGAERETDDRLGAELGLDACVLDRLLLRELRRDNCPSTDEATSIVRASTKANMAAFEYFFSTNIVQLLSPAV